MCNAFSFRRTADEMDAFAQELGLVVDTIPERPIRYRIGPRDRHIMIRQSAEGPKGDIGQFDLIPPGKSKPFLRTNARADGLRNTWPWKMLLKHSRCLVPADGFYEPEKPARAKGTVPWSYYTLDPDTLFMMAGLFNETVDEETGEVVTSFTIITTEANETIRIHDRMPVILHKKDAASWLEGAELPDTLLTPYTAPMQGWRVGDDAKSSRKADHPGMITPIEEQLGLF